MKENIELLRVRYLNEKGYLISDDHACESARTRISVYIDFQDNTHHIEFNTRTSVDEVAALLMTLADKLIKEQSNGKD